MVYTKKWCSNQLARWLCPLHHLMFFVRSSCATEFSLLLGYLKHIPGAAVMPAFAETFTGHRSSYKDNILVEESDDLAGHVFPSRLLMVHNTGRCSQNNVAELTRWQQFNDPLLEITERDVVSWRDDTGLVEAAVQLNDNLAVAMIVNFFKFADIA